jgi:type II secretory pathway pseudopilin PulG
LGKYPKSTDKNSVQSAALLNIKQIIIGRRNVPVRLKNRLRSWLEDQRGLSLIEILGAVTIMSIISVTLMGYFITGLNKSEEQSRRIIAVNLARLKAAEIRQYLKPNSSYTNFIGPIPSNAVNTFNTVIGHIRLDPKQVNGTTYQYLVSLDSRITQVRNAQLDNQFQSLLSTPDQYLIPMSITVFWGNDSTLRAKSTAIETYVVNRGVQ